MTDMDPAWWFARTDGQAAAQGSAHEEKAVAVAHAEIDLSVLDASAGAARVVFDDAVLKLRTTAVGESDWSLLRRRLHEHLDHALEAAQATSKESPTSV